MYHRHCTGDRILSGEVQCSRRDRDYNINLRVGLVFAMLATSFIGKRSRGGFPVSSSAGANAYAGVALPIFLKPLLPGRFHIVFTVLKQFGTGVIVATALIHVSFYRHVWWALCHYYLNLGEGGCG